MAITLTDSGFAAATSIVANTSFAVGDLIIVCTQDNPAGSGAISDNLNGTYTNTTGFSNSGIGYWNVAWVIVTTAGMPTISGDADANRITYLRYSGFAGTPTMISADISTGNAASGTALNSGSFSTSQNNEYVFSFLGSGSGFSGGTGGLTIGWTSEANSSQFLESFIGGAPTALASGTSVAITATLNSSAAWGAGVYGFYDNTGVRTNGATVSGNSNSSATSNTFAYLTPTGTTALVVTENNTGTGVTPTGVTYNGVSLTMVPSSSVINPNGSFCESSIWYLLMPPTGTSYNIVISYGASVGQFAAGATPLIGVNQSSPVRTAATASGVFTSPSNPAVTATGGVSGDLYIGTTFAGSAVTSTGSSTELWNTSALGIATSAAGDSLPGSGAGAFTWTQMSPANDWTASAVAFEAGGGEVGGGALFNRRRRGRGR